MTFDAIDIALSAGPGSERRRQLGEVLLRIIGADAFVSYLCDETGPYRDPVEVNLGSDAIHAYDQHYRNVDRLTPVLFARRRTSRISPPSAASDEFVHDFLHRRDLYHGMNFFAPDAGPGSIDLRVWRGRGAAPFTPEDAGALRALGTLITRLWPREAPAASAALTPREVQIAGLVAAGRSDKEIASRLGISPATLRTHLAHSFAKTNAPNRTALATHYLRHHQK